ncbi:hypothetical protein [Bradyrhizobium sp. dw_78]|uniref:hypothetical protein n=1 Tax=Bradyrhizobium sp. dw_78 TaxID=2719793 RepID=UPI001BD65967|nr:hypothetical protein [Bradyrhizobium sp. dw_78]
MGETLGRGILGSLRKQVAYDLRNLSHDNRALRLARYSAPRRWMGHLVSNRSITQFLAFYVIVLVGALLLEWAGNQYIPSRLPGYIGQAPRDFLKDIGSYLIAAQIGILAIVSVAVGVVTLLSERNDGSSVNTDIRLYYVESYSYELAISGVALLVVLTLQLFWPSQHILHVLGLGGRDYTFKLALASLHALWFTFNLFLFLQFITTTLRFVEPNTRERLRERYCANEVIPRDVEKRMMRALLYNAPRRMFGEKALSEGPNIGFGHGLGLGDAPTPEIATVFSRPMRLVDVRLKPLRWVLRRWRGRVQKIPPGRRRVGQPAWNEQLTIAANFDEIYEGRSEWVLRRGTTPLTPFERWVIRRCLRFRRVPSREQDMPTPENFLEQLIDKAVKQIEESAETGFRAALAETVQYHQFILAAQNTRDAAGNAFNLAEVGGFFTRPDTEWVRQYRRAFTAAADKIGSDTYFIDRMSSLAARLVPEDASNFSSRVLQSLLDLGIQEIVALEDWITKRAVIGHATDEAGASTSLGGSDKRAYEAALIEFVGGWESALQTLVLSYGLERRPASRPADQSWRAFRASFSVLQHHLHNAAYFFAASVWNDDALGADRLRDLLLRWPQPFYANLQSSYLFSNTFFFTPDLISQDWSTVQAYVAHHVQFQQEEIQPGPVSGILLWELHGDVVCISGLVALHWYATKQQPSETAARAAVQTLNRTLRSSDGSTLTEMTPKTTFRLLFEFYIRYALTPRFTEGRYSATLDGLIRHLTEPASPRMVSGRIYGAFGLEGVDTLRPALVGAMLANLPEQGDDGVAVPVDAMKGDPILQDDRTVETLIWPLQQIEKLFNDPESMQISERAARVFKPDVDFPAGAERLRAMFAAAVSAFQTLRKNRLRTAPLDEQRMQIVRQQMTEAALAHGPAVACFQGYSIHRRPGGVAPPSEHIFQSMDKGLFTVPVLSRIDFDEMPSMFVLQSQVAFADSLWQELYQRAKLDFVVDVSDGSEPFWRRVIEQAASVGPTPIAIVPHSGCGQDITAAVMGMPGAPLSDFDVWHVRNMPSGGGVGYQGTINGVHVYSANVMVNQALLCSSEIIRSIDYDVVHGDGDVVDFSFIDGEDLSRSKVRLRFSQHIEWADTPVVKFMWAVPDASHV